MKSEEIILLYKQTFNAWNVLLMLCAWITVRTAQRVLPEVFDKPKKGTPFIQQLPHRLLPVYPIWFCTACYTLIPGPWIAEGLALSQKALLGVFCGYVAGHSHAVLVRLLPAPLQGIMGSKSQHDASASAPAPQKEKPDANANSSGGSA